MFRLVKSFCSYEFLVVKGFDELRVFAVMSFFLFGVLISQGTRVFAVVSFY